MSSQEFAPQAPATPPSPPPPDNATRGHLAMALGLLWLGGIGSLAALVLGLRAKRTWRSDEENRLARDATLLGVFGLVLSASLFAGAVFVPNDARAKRRQTDGSSAPVTSAAPLSVPPTTALAPTTIQTAARPTTTAAAEPTCPLSDASSPRRTRFTAAPPGCVDAAKTYSATIVTNLGTLTVVLDQKAAPVAVNNFVFLSRWRFFDSTACHRAIPGFMVQCGDPTGSGRGGPGYTIPDELPAAGSYKVGSLAMANAGPNTSGSQFFIVTGATGTRLPPSYTLVGQVTTGLEDVLPKLDAAGNPDASANGVPPRQPIVIASVTISEQ